ncbi:aspartate kinase [bacterium]|nr:aspartate kinase [bacterium]
MVVMKFGGSCLANGEQFINAAELVKNHPGSDKIVVVSAVYKITDKLLDTGALAMERKMNEVEENVNYIRQKHHHIIEYVVEDGEERKKILKEKDTGIDELEQIYKGIMLINELTKRSLDVISSFGERLSSMIFSAALRRIGVNSFPVDARIFMTTDNTYGNAIVDLDTTKNKFKKDILPKIDGVIPVITGFIGATPGGITTTIGRNGTDYTASIVGYSIDADEILIWKDVDGVLTADPRIYDGATVVSKISYQEASEISHFGGEVIHPKTMQPAVIANIPIRIKNTFNPDFPGTVISSQSDDNLRTLITCSIDDLALITVEGAGLQATPKLIVKVLAAVAKVDVNIYMISMASSEYNISFLVKSSDTEKALQSLHEELEFMRLVERSINQIVIERNVAIIACVGSRLKGRVGIAGKIFSTFGSNGINIIAIAQGSSEYNISIVVDSSNMKKSVACLQEELSGKI